MVGCTRYANIDQANRKLEIGWTFVAPAWQRTRINTEAKYLMLRYAFETLGCIRVELKTDALNQTSRRAIARIGAREEGTLRHHMICAGRPLPRHGLLQRDRPAGLAAASEGGAPGETEQPQGKIHLMSEAENNPPAAGGFSHAAAARLIFLSRAFPAHAGGNATWADALRRGGAPQAGARPGPPHASICWGCLSEKTKGNLSLEEQRLLENSLTELRFRFVQVSEEVAKAAAQAKA